MIIFSIFLSVYFLTVGLLFIVFNKKISEYEFVRRSKKSKTVDEKLIKTQFYIAGGLSLFAGIFQLGWASGFFSK